MMPILPKETYTAWTYFAPNKTSDGGWVGTEAAPDRASAFEAGVDHVYGYRAQSNPVESVRIEKTTRDATGRPLGIVDVTAEWIEEKIRPIQEEIAEREYDPVGARYDAARERYLEAAE